MLLQKNEIVRKYGPVLHLNKMKKKDAGIRNWRYEHKKLYLNFCPSFTKKTTVNDDILNKTIKFDEPFTYTSRIVISGKKVTFSWDKFINVVYLGFS